MFTVQNTKMGNTQTENVPRSEHLVSNKDITNKLILNINNLIL